ncbi:hypothetical protein ANN_21856 [Periplaneta americana]|uniref:Odorant receptor n=1 Tax=Periplaneta americana TaxID=6978 RepID=A0ABQ8S6T1_PERAM|nr:hypothetical protein ANN_21856 [Periplaneta americana]
MSFPEDDNANSGNNTIVLELPFVAYHPYDVENNITNYIFTYLFQVFCGYSVFIGMPAFDMLFVSVFIHLSGHFKALQYVLFNLHEEAEALILPDKNQPRNNRLSTIVESPDAQISFRNKGCDSSQDVEGESYYGDRKQNGLCDRQLDEGMQIILINCIQHHQAILRRLRWAGHVARMGESRNAYRVLVGRPEGKRPLGRPRRRWEDNIKMDLREVGYDDREWINFAQDRDQWRAYVGAAMNLRLRGGIGRFPATSHVNATFSELCCLHCDWLPNVIVSYLGYQISYEEEKDLNEKITKFNRVMRIINQVFKPTLVQEHTRSRIYKTLARPILCFGSEAWTIRNIDSQRLTAAEMRFMRRTAGYTRMDHINNLDIMKELQIGPITEYLQKYRQNWRSHVIRMLRSRIPRQEILGQTIPIQTEGTKFIKLSVSLVTALVEQGMFYWFAGELLEESVNTLSAAYHCKWYITNKTFRQDLLLLMERAKRQVKLTAGGFSTLTLQNFASINSLRGNTEGGGFGPVLWIEFGVAQWSERLVRRTKDPGDNAGEMCPGSNTESYPAFARIGLRENPGKNLNQITCPDRDSNPGHLVSRPDALTVTPQVWTLFTMG